MPEYSAEQIAVHTWPAVEQMPDGRWKRAFNITLKELHSTLLRTEELSAAITKDVIEYLQDDDRGFSFEDDILILVHVNTPLEITATVITVGHGNWDEYMVAAWRMFEDIDRLLGSIDTIEGQERNVWPPWSLQRYRRNDQQQ